MEQEDKLKEEFNRIYKKSKKINLKRVSEVYNSIKEKQRTTKEPSTITEISSDTGLKKTTIRTYIIHLENNKYIKKSRKYTPPFLKATDIKEEAEFIYGKDKRDIKTEEETKNVLEETNNITDTLKKEIHENLSYIKKSKEYNSKFLDSYNKVIKYLWKNGIGKKLVKLEIGSGANRYFLY